MFPLGTDTQAILYFGNITDKVLTLLTNLLMLHFFSEGTMVYQEAWSFHFHVKPCCKKPQQVQQLGRTLDSEQTHGGVWFPALVQDHET